MQKTRARLAFGKELGDPENKKTARKLVLFLRGFYVNAREFPGPPAANDQNLTQSSAHHASHHLPHQLTIPCKHLVVLNSLACHDPRYSIPLKDCRPV